MRAVVPFVALLACTPARGAELHRGTASVVDGDTVDIHGVNVRLSGVDAPEMGQTCTDGAGRAYPCGGRAANALQRIIGDRLVTCTVHDVDRWGRPVATCLAGTVDLGAAIVREGWALAYRDYSTAYVDEEAVAKAAGVGLWAGTFTPPWTFRAEKRARPRAAATPRPDDGCCAHCATGKACGDTCIAEASTCTRPPGCACDAAP